jgi:hypothetical protein
MPFSSGSKHPFRTEEESKAQVHSFLKSTILFLDEMNCGILGESLQ